MPWHARHTAKLYQLKIFSLPSASVEFILLMLIWCQQKLLPLLWYQRNEEEDKSDSDLDVDEENNSLDFFAERTRELLHIKSEGLKAKKERKTLSKITSGRAITEPEVSAKIMEHVSAAA